MPSRSPSPSSSSTSRGFIARLTPDLTTLQSIAFLDDGVCQDIAIGPSGDIYVAGHTSSTLFPTTPGAYDPTFGSSSMFKGFISRLDPTLTTLLASTYFGGNRVDMIYTICLDPFSNVYVGGETRSADFPITPNAFQKTISGGGNEGFISKLDPGLSTLLASTFLGGEGLDIVYSLALDSSLNIYASGETDSWTFPVTPGAFDTEAVYFEAFVSRLTGDLSSLLASTYLGGSYGDVAYSLALTGSGNVCLAGQTTSSDFPVTPTALKKGFTDESISEIDGFVSILSADLASLLASTYFGGDLNDECYSLAIDSQDHIYVAGTTASPNFPITQGSFDATFNGGVIDFFISRLNPSLSLLEASTYLGGSNTGGVGNILLAPLAPSGQLIIAGVTSSVDFPTTPGAFAPVFMGVSDSFVSRFGLQEIIDVEVTIDTVPPGLTVIVDDVPYQAPQVFFWREYEEHVLSVPAIQGDGVGGAPLPADRLKLGPGRRRVENPLRKRPADSSRTSTGALASSSTASTASARTLPLDGQSGGTRHVFSSWSDGGNRTHSITVHSCTWQYTAYLTTQYSLDTSANPSEGGVVTPSGLNWFNQGSVVEVSARPNTHYEFDSWTGDASGTANPQTVTMDEPKTIVANFTLMVSYPPLNLRLTRLENNLIFFKEYVNRLTWDENPQNTVQVVKYRIYGRRINEAGEDYRLLGEVNYPARNFDHRGLKQNDLYTYRVTTVNSYSYESPPAEIGN